MATAEKGIQQDPYPQTEKGCEKLLVVSSPARRDGYGTAVSAEQGLHPGLHVGFRPLTDFRMVEACVRGALRLDVPAGDFLSDHDRLCLDLEQYRRTREAYCVPRAAKKPRIGFRDHRPNGRSFLLAGGIRPYFADGRSVGDGSAVLVRSNQWFHSKQPIDT